ncbi:hypothetical protein MHK_003685 [Candidatus Magnetomorum sp. HK-1]|nr:hypothetical protein MHK_003685 [Candidatus Magnetomorum sp. HK-1]
MLVTNIFDTHESFKVLTQAGFTEEQAEGQVKIISNLIEDKLATKNDLLEIENSMTIKMQQMENSMTIKLKEMENSMQQMENKMLSEILHTRSDLVKWIAGLMVAQAAVFVAMFKIFSQ